jgi:hypothetical protein
MLMALNSLVELCNNGEKVFWFLDSAALWPFPPLNYGWLYM